MTSSNTPVKINQMLSVNRCQLPENALLNKYAKSGDYTDCYTTEISGNVSHGRYVSAFYTTCLFKLERFILKWAVSKPSSDTQALQLAEGKTHSFAAWSVEDSCESQLLLSDFTGRTRSWLMVVSVDSGENKTRLYFGSAVIRQQNLESAGTSSGFSLLIQLHKIYSILLLYSARLRLKRRSF